MKGTGFRGEMGEARGIGGSRVGEHRRLRACWRKEESLLTGGELSGDGGGRGRGSAGERGEDNREARLMRGAVCRQEERWQGAGSRGRSVEGAGVRAELADAVRSALGGAYGLAGVVREVGHLAGRGPARWRCGGYARSSRGGSTTYRSRARGAGWPRTWGRPRRACPARRARGPSRNSASADAA